MATILLRRSSSESLGPTETEIVRSAEGMKILKILLPSTLAPPGLASDAAVADRGSVVDEASGEMDDALCALWIEGSVLTESEGDLRR